MSKEEDLLDLATNLVAHARRAGADQAEAVVSTHRTIETRVEGGEVHTVQTTDETLFGIRVFIGGSLGFATANATDPCTIDESISEAVAQARATPTDPCNRLPVVEPASAVEGLFDERVATMTVDDTTALAVRMLSRAADRDGRVRIDSGGVSAESTRFALVSSEGASASEASTLLRGFLFGMAVDGDEVASFDYDGDATRTRAGIESRLDEATDRFVTKCLAGLGAHPGRSLRGAVVLSPEAVGEFLLSDLIAAVSADNVRKGRSPFTGKMDKRIAATSLTVIDDPTVAGAVGSTAFDREGVPTTRHVILDAGVLRGYLFDHYEALAAGTKQRSTGHAAGGASALPAIAPHQVEIAAGHTALSEICGGAEPVVYVGRFSGSTNPVTGEFSGVVKNGFLVENGERRPINETLIAGNLFEALEQISAISRERRRISGTELLPAVRLEGISVTAA